MFWNQAEDLQPAPEVTPEPKTDASVTRWLVAMHWPVSAKSWFVLRERHDGEILSAHGRSWPTNEEDGA
jgi:hypothetical protein